VKIRKELWFGFTIMALIITPVIILTPWGNLFDAHLAREDLGVLGLLMLALIVVAIMLGFPTAFTLMGLGVFFAWLSYRSVNPDLAVRQTLDLMVQRTYGVMSNDVLIAVPLFVFMGYLVERAQLIDRLFKSLHLATTRVPGSLAVATIVTCAIFATATGIVGAVVTLMGLLAFPQMLRAGYNTKVAAGSVTAGGCLGILIPPSVLLIVYGATAGVSVVQLYAGAFFPGIMLALLYVGYVIVLAKWRPALMPPLAEEDSRVPLSPPIRALAQRGGNAVLGLWRGMTSNLGVAKSAAFGNLVVSLLPAITIVMFVGVIYRSATAPAVEASTAGLIEAGGQYAADIKEESAGLIGAPPESSGTGLQEPPAEGAKELSTPTGAESAAPQPLQEPPGTEKVAEAKPAETAAAPAKAAAPERVPVPNWFWWVFGVGALILIVVYWMWNWERLEVFKLLLTSFFPLAVLIIAVLGSIVFGLATPAEAAAVGAFGGCILALIYRYINHWNASPRGQRSMGSTLIRTGRDFGAILKESSFLTAKTSAMVCWLFVGSAIFSAAFALLGGQEIIEKWVLSLNMTPLQFMILAQFIIFILGWPLEWTEIIVIFMPIFIPLLPHFNIDPLFFGLLVALNLQTAFLSPPVAMAAFYLKGVSPPHVTLNQIFAGMMPFMAIQVVALVLLYTFPGIGLWLPNVLYGR
jgi:TRAP-type mannitol/chloroaromatic compound transport system permease large subunit